jgi:hypothetical protein
MVTAVIASNITDFVEVNAGLEQRRSFFFLYGLHPLVCSNSELTSEILCLVDNEYGSLDGRSVRRKGSIYTGQQISSPNITKVIKSKEMRRAGHVASV